MSEVYEPTEHEIEIGIGIIKQIIQNRGHQLDVVRETLSNSCSKEVRASYFKITIFYDGTYGWSFVFEDDGIGMSYTKAREPEKQGRLDRFLNLSYSGVVGLTADEFGFKGLGSKLLYLCKKLEIQTKTDSGECYKVEVHDPIGKLLKDKPEKPKPLIYKLPPDALPYTRGTVIRVYGYDNGRKYPEYEDPEQLKRYLHFRTLCGYTRPERQREGFPKIMIKTPVIEEGEDLNVGFPWIRKEGNHVEGQKIGTLDPPIQVTEEDRHGNRVTVLLRGGYALQTGEFPGLTGGISNPGVGLAYAWKGIPYFNLDFNEYKPEGFDLYYRFCRFVVECDDVETDIARSRIVADGVKEPLFAKALREAFRRIMTTDDYKDWIRHRRELKRKDLGQSLNQRKDELLGREQRWVFFNGQLIHKEPTSEQDVRALLWKLEGMKTLPFHYFRTLEHMAQRGIDIIADYQEESFSEKKVVQAVEVEYVMENYADHDHTPEQTSLLIAWDARQRDKLTKAKGDWKYVWSYAGANLNVALLRYLPGLEVKTK